MTVYNRARALFPDVVTGFIEATQPKEWAKLEALHGANTSARVLDDLCKWLETYGAHVRLDRLPQVARCPFGASQKALHAVMADLSVS